MEDSHIANFTDMGQNIAIFGVFDGHGGKHLLWHVWILFRHGSGGVLQKALHRVPLEKYKILIWSVWGGTDWKFYADGRSDAEARGQEGNFKD